jgi:hypothetical protein
MQQLCYEWNVPQISWKSSLERQVSAEQSVNVTDLTVISHSDMYHLVTQTLLRGVTLFP